MGKGESAVATGQGEGVSEPRDLLGKCSSCPLWQISLRDQLEDGVPLCSHPGRVSTQNIPGTIRWKPPCSSLPPLLCKSLQHPSARSPPLLLLRCASSLTQMRAPTRHLSQAPQQGGTLPTACPNCPGAPCAPLAGSSPALPGCCHCSATTCSAVTNHRLLYCADLPWSRWSLGFKTPQLYKPLSKPPT